MKLKEAVRFCNRFGPGLRAGLDVIRLLESEARQGPPSQQKAMHRLLDRLHSGDEVGEAMAKDIFFPKTLAAIMMAGDESGKVDRAILLLGKHYESRLEAKRRFLKAIALPLLQFVGGIIVISIVIWLMGVLVPAGGGEMSDILGFGLRGATGVLWFWTYLCVTFAFIFTAIWCFTRNAAGVQNLVPFLYMIPKLGPAIQTITLAKFCTAMALAVEAGLDPIRSIRLGLASTGSEYYQSVGDRCETAIRKGADLSGALKSSGIFPKEILEEINIAEESGTSAEAMNRLSEDYDRRAQTAVTVMATMASILIRVIIMGLFIYMIFRVASMYLGAINSAMEPI
jgi:type II secretory pathway component PulF